jgi:hypothetical protein
LADTRRIALEKVDIDEDQRLVFGLASMSTSADGELVTDSEGDQIEPAELERAMYEYALFSGQGDENHDKVPKSQLVESFVVTPKKLELFMKAIGSPADVSEYKGVAVWVGYKVFDDGTWARVKSGELRAFSIECEAFRAEAA